VIAAARVAMAAGEGSIVVIESTSASLFEQRPPEA
jgi:hypothetical protein